MKLDAILPGVVPEYEEAQHEQQAELESFVRETSPANLRQESKHTTNSSASTGKRSSTSSSSTTTPKGRVLWHHSSPGRSRKTPPRTQSTLSRDRAHFGAPCAISQVNQERLSTLDDQLVDFKDDAIASAAAAWGSRPITMLMPSKEFQCWYFVNLVINVATAILLIRWGTVNGIDHGWIVHGFGQLGFALGIISIFFLGYHRRQVRRARTVFASCIFVTAVIDLAVGIIAILGMLPKVHTNWFGNGLFLLPWVYIWGFKESWYIPAKAAMFPGLLSMGVGSIYMDPMFDAKGTLVTLGLVQIPYSFCFLGLVITYYVLRRRTIAMADATISFDRSQYLESWSQILQNAAERDAVDRLSSYVKQLRLADCHRKQAAHSLEALYSDAEDIYDAFSINVHDWASRSGGIQRNCGLKGHKRAIEKVKRAYNDDAASLQDIVRSSIVFDSVEQVLTCLQLIVAEAEVSRIKNRFDPDYDATKHSIGYRDLSINLALPGPNGRKHLAELQLHLRLIFDLKSDGGHKRYIEWRNLRGS